MKFFVALRTRLLTLSELSHMDTDSLYTSSVDSAMRIAR